MNKIEIYKSFNFYQAKIDENTFLYDVNKELAEYIIELQKENKDLKDNLMESMQNAYNQGCKYTEHKYQDLIKEAIDYIKTTQYSDVAGLNKYSILEFWFIKDVLEILERTENK